MLKKLTVVLVLLLAGSTAFAESPDNGLCVDYSGKAFGICTSAVNNACGTENETNEQACDNMEDHFIDATGEMPPWLIPSGCPCYTVEDAERIVLSDDFVGCGIWVNHRRFKWRQSISGPTHWRPGYKSLGATEMRYEPVLDCYHLRNDAGVVTYSSWTGDASNPDDRVLYENCNDVQNYAIEKYDLTCYGNY